MPKVLPFLLLLWFFAGCSFPQESKIENENSDPTVASTLDRGALVSPSPGAEQLRNEQTPPLHVTSSPTNTPASLPTLGDAGQANSNADPKEVLSLFYEMLNQKECAAAFDLFTLHRAWGLSKEDYVTTCENNYASVVIIEVQPFSQWVTDVKCHDVVQMMRESATRQSFFLREKWTVRPEDSEKAPPGFQYEQVVPSWVSIESENGRWKISSFFSSPPCNDDDLKWETVESNLSELDDTLLPQTPEDVVKSYYRYFTGKQCLAAYNLLSGEAAEQNPKDDAISFCHFDPRTWELVQIMPFFEKCRADDNLWDNEIRRKFYVKIRLMGRPMLLGKGLSDGFMMEHFYELALTVELVDSSWRITQIEPWYAPDQCYVQP